MNASQLIDERIRRFVSAGDDSDWQEVVRRAGLTEPDSQTAVVRRGRPRPPVGRRSLVPAFVLLLLVAAGAAVAAVGGLPWWQSGTPPVDPQAVAAVARDNMPANVDTAHARTVAQAGDAALVAVPLNQSGYCLIPALDGRGDLGAQCEFQVTNPQRGDDDRLESYARPSSRPGGPAWIVYGRVTNPQAATLDLSEAAGGPLAISLQPGGFFLAQIPADRWAALANHAGPGRILDASGTTLRTGCINWGPSPDSPTASGSDTLLWSDTGGGACKPQSPSPTLATADLANAHKLVELTLTGNYGIYKQGTTIALWEAPGASGGDCVFDAKADEPPTPFGSNGDNPVGGGSCNPSGVWLPPNGNPITVTLGATRLGSGDYAGLVQGHVDPASGISRLKLRGATEKTAVTLSNGWFLAELPVSSNGQLPAGGPWLLSGYNSAGNEVTHVNLNALQAQAEPH